jgi:hypothetical protein
MRRNYYLDSPEYKFRLPDRKPELKSITAEEIHYIGDIAGIQQAISFV